MRQLPLHPENGLRVDRVKNVNNRLREGPMRNLDHGTILFEQLEKMLELIGNVAAT